MSELVFWLRTQRRGHKPPIEGQCQHVHPSGMRCGQALWRKDGQFCYAHSPMAKRKRAGSDWDHYGTCPKCNAKRGDPCVTAKGIPTFKHVGRIPKPRNRLRFEDHGPVEAQLLELGGAQDDEGMVSIMLRCKPAEARKLAPALFEWGELTMSVATITPAPPKPRRS